jgi:hypothetical protein
MTSPVFAAIAPPVASACDALSAPGADLMRQGPGRTQVLCGSVERVANRAIRVRSDCRLMAGTWECQPRGKEFALELNGRRVTVDYPVEMSSWSAFRMVQAIGPSVVPLAAAGARTPRDREDRCSLSGDDSDPQVARMTLRCTLWTVEFVKLCNASGCRYEPAAMRGSGGARSRDDRRGGRGSRPDG